MDRSSVSHRVRAAVLFAVALAVGCGNSLQPGDAPVRTFVDQRSAETPMDLLVVVDDSAGMAPYADSLAVGFPEVAGVLEGLWDGLPSTHAAFVSATLSSGACVGQGPRGAACGLPAEPFAIVDGCGANPNFSGTLASTFGCLGDFGTSGCAAPTPLAALRHALGGDGGQGALSGPTPFLRPEAGLAILIVTSANDASLASVQEYADFIKSLKADPANMVFVSVVAAFSPDSAPPPRLTAFVQSFGGNGLLYPLTAGQGFAPALQTIAQRLAVLIAPPCVTGVRDMRPDLPGLQPDCTAENSFTAVDGTTLRHVHAPMPSCDVASPPCWSLSADSPVGFCPPGAWAWHIDRGSDSCPQFAAKTVLTCRGCADPNDPACAGP
jgi:hypothetical protein